MEIAKRLMEQCAVFFSFDTSIFMPHNVHQFPAWMRHDWVLVHPTVNTVRHVRRGNVVAHKLRRLSRVKDKTCPLWEDKHQTLSLLCTTRSTALWRQIAAITGSGARRPDVVQRCRPDSRLESTFPRCWSAKRCIV